MLAVHCSVVSGLLDFRLVTITTSAGWRDIGAFRELCRHRIFTIDAPPIGPEEHEPLLVLHGFPTSSFDYAAVSTACAQDAVSCCSTTSASASRTSRTFITP